jgi:hypothetical protein
VVHHQRKNRFNSLVFLHKSPLIVSSGSSNRIKHSLICQPAF